MCHKLGKMVYEVLPQKVPYGQWSEVERHLWSIFLEFYHAKEKAEQAT